MKKPLTSDVPQITDETSLRFSMATLAHIAITIIIAALGYSQLESGIRELYNQSDVQRSRLNTVENHITENQDKPIPSDYVQNTKIALMMDRLIILEARVYEHNHVEYITKENK